MKLSSTIIARCVKYWSEHSFVQLLTYLSIVFLLFGSVGTFDFNMWDDGLHVSQNPYIVKGGVGQSLAYFWTNIHKNLYMPLTYTFWKIFYVFTEKSGIPPACFFHWVNLVFHGANSYLVFKIFHHLGLRNRTAFIGGLFFLIHPVQVESFAWISEFKGLLAFFWSALAVLQFLDLSVGSNKKNHILALLFFILALLSKPSVISLPILFFLLSLYKKRSVSESIVRILPFLACSFALAIVTTIAQPASCVHLVHLPLWQRTILPFHVIGFYSSQLLFPFPLLSVYGQTPSYVISHLSSVFYWLVGLLLVLAAFKYRKLRWIWLYSLILIPVLGFIPFIYERFSLTADRYMYLSMPVAIFGLIRMCSLDRISPKIKLFASLFLLIVFVSISTTRLKDWRNTGTLHIATLKYNPSDPTSYVNLSSFFVNNNENEAVITLMDTYRKNGVYALRVELNYAKALSRIGRRKESEEILRAEYNKSHVNMTFDEKYSLDSDFAQLLLKRNQLDSAQYLYNNLFPLFSDSAAIPFNIGVIYLKRAEERDLSRSSFCDTARGYFLAALSIDNSYSGALFNLGSQFYYEGRYDSAEYYFRKVDKRELSLYNNARNFLSNLSEKKEVKQ